jgi:hypothetical protein
VKIRTRRFSGRCSRHKRYNPAVDGRGAIVGACTRCTLLAEIWETALKLNSLIRKCDPNHDDVQRPRRKAEAHGPDPRQMSLIPE